MKVTGRILLVLLTISLIFGGVHFIRISFLTPGEKYTPLVTVGTDIHTVDEVFYAQRLQKVLGGTWLVGDRHFYEHRADAFIYPTLSPFIFGSLARIIGGVENVFILTDFIFPPITFLLIYLIIYMATHIEVLSLAGSISVVMYDMWQKLLRSLVLLDPWYFVQHTFGGDGRVLHFSRFEAQEFVIPLILTAITLLWISVEKKSWRYCIVSGIIFGINFYIYPYSVLFYAVGTVIYASYLLFRKLKIEALISLLALSTGLIIGSIYFLNWLKFLELPQAAELVQRATIIEHYSLWEIIRRYGHYFIFSTFLFWVSRHSLLNYVNAYLFGNLLLLAFFPYGKTYHLDVYLGFWFPLTLFCAFGVMYSSYSKNITRLWKKVIRLGWFMFFILLLVSGAVKHWGSAYASRGAFTLDSDTRESYLWLKGHTDPDSVVLTLSQKTNRELPAYTPNYIFLGRGEFTYAPTREIIERISMSYKYFDVSLENLSLVFTGMDNGNMFPYKAPYSQETIERLGGYYYFGPQVKSAPDLEDLLQLYRKTPRLKLMAINQKYRIDYVYVGPYERLVSNYDPATDSELEQVFNSNTVQIYKRRS